MSLFHKKDQPKHDQPSAAVVRDFYEALPAGDADRIKHLIDPDCRIQFVFATPPIPEDLVPPKVEGPGAALGFFEAAAPMFANMKIDDLAANDLAGMPDWAVVRFKGEAPLPTGRTYANTYIAMIRVADGRIKEIVEYSNPLIILQAFVGDIRIDPYDEPEA